MNNLIFNQTSYSKKSTEMKRQLWGELSDKPDEETVQRQNLIDREIMMEKRGKEIKSLFQLLVNTLYLLWILN